MTKKNEHFSDIKEQLQIARSAKARRVMRRQGLNGADIDALQSWLWLKMKNPRGGCADLARVLQVDRSTAHRRLERLCDFGVLAKVGRTYLSMLRSLLRGSIKVVRKLKRDCPKTLKLKALSRFVADLTTLTCSDKSSLRKREESLPIPARQTALAELDATYIPVHLRKAR